MDTTPENRTGLLIRNGIIAVATVVIAALVFFASRSQAPTLAQLAETGVPLDQALANGRPTLVEFYTDQCTVCQAMAPTVAQLKERYGKRVNFVILNANNPRWLPELVQYKVEGVPHYAFLNSEGRRLGEAIGQQPEAVLEKNLIALADGKPALPEAGVAAGRTSAVKLPAQKTQPRDHS